jgi:CrcB protein
MTRTDFIMNIIYVALGGALGASLRYLVYLACAAGKLTTFPLATLLVNLIGSFLIGMLAYGLLTKYMQTDAGRLFLIIGVLGAFTTFSTFSLDSLQLILAQRYLAAAGYMLANLFGCLLATTLGMLIVNLK